MNLLKIKYNRPIEREFESWIIEGIERYFRKINKRIAIFALSPSQEKHFPADEVMTYDNKVIGLQFKKADLGGYSQAINNLSNLKWEIRDTKQFSFIQNRDFIYYCLPTFMNREYKNVALDHCIFWKPGRKDNPTTYWYDNDKAKSGNGVINKEGMRWGAFIERVYNCELGLLRKASQPIRNEVLDSLHYAFRDENAGILYLFVIEL